jgi:hypothetical protein
MASIEKFGVQTSKGVVIKVSFQGVTSMIKFINEFICLKTMGC